MHHLWRVVLFLVAGAAAGTAAPSSTAAGATGSAVQHRQAQVSAAGLLPDGSEARLYDWTRAGFGAGTQDFPEQVGAGTFDVTASGLKSDGSQYADQAVKDALKQALKAGGVVYFPKGTFKLSKPLYVDASNVVFRGAGLSSTKIVLTKSLTDVYGVNSVPDECTGESKNLWSWSGGFLTFDGTKKIAATPKELARVPSDKTVKPGDTKLPVTSTSKFWKGQWVVLYIDDKSTAPDLEAECDYREGDQQRLQASAAWPQPNLPAWVRRDPLFQLAVNTAQAAADERRRDVSDLAQVAGLGAASSVPVAPAKAEKGTVAAWVYGENSVDSGGPNAIDLGQTRYVFQVKDKGVGYIVPDRPLILAVKPGWTAVIRQYKPAIKFVGVQDLTITFKDSGRYEGHFSDQGYNAINMVNVTHGFVRNVQIENADNAVLLQNVDFSTLSDIVVTTGDRTHTDGKNMNGHHAINIASGQSNLVTRFNIKQRYYHDVGVSNSAILNVYSNGGGADLNMEHHRAGPMGNLFSNIDVGKNTRPFRSGGREDRGAHTGRGGTFWNVRAGSSASDQKVKLPDCDFGPLLTFVLPKRGGSSCSSMGWKATDWTSSKPVDLHKAQLDARKK